MFGIGSRNKNPEPDVKWDGWNCRFEFTDGKIVTLDTIGELTFYSEEFQEEMSVRRFLRLLLSTLWTEGETFNPKKPFGLREWKEDMLKEFVSRGIIKGLTIDGMIQSADTITFDYLIKILIERGL